MEQTVETRSPDETESFGECLGTGLRAGDVVALIGGLGSGKTCLTRGIVRGAGSSDRVSSPTFVLIHEYALPPDHGPAAIYHFDLYRLDDPATELEEIGGVDLLHGNGISIVEWAERAGDVLPPDAIRVHLDVADETTRRIRVTGRSVPVAARRKGERA